MNVLVFGATGNIGKAIVEELRATGHFVTTVSRKSSTADIQINENFQELSNLKLKFNGCIWAQGVNINDTLISANSLDEILDVNLKFIINSLRVLLNNDMLEKNARLTIVSSIWQSQSKKNKFSYTISKSAIEGLINSFIADYSEIGYSINAVLPGVVDSKMTRQNLSEKQISNIESQTPTKNLVSTTQVAKVVSWLTSGESAGINGQFIKIDNGWSNIRVI
jgi:NAD(P)-dependent dehydrogenase (short-subunit alcohol dehydrogenase family)